MPGDKRIIFDADGLIGLVNDKDALHERCLEIFDFLQKERFILFALYPIVLEAATALTRDRQTSRRDLAAKLLNDYSDIDVQLILNEKVSETVATLYTQQTSKKNSPFDHYVLAVARKNGIKFVFSFDSFYSKNGLKLIEGFMES